MKKILIGDISDTILDVLEFTFEKRNFAVMTARNSSGLLSALEEQDSDMVLLNTHLEDIEGIELVLKIKEKKPQIPILFMSNSQNFELKLNARKLGVDGWILKPFIAERLVEAIEAHFFSAY